jgi:hypothetical protein
MTYIHTGFRIPEFRIAALGLLHTKHWMRWLVMVAVRESCLHGPNVTVCRAKLSLPLCTQSWGRRLYSRLSL